MAMWLCRSVPDPHGVRWMAAQTRSAFILLPSARCCHWSSRVTHTLWLCYIAVNRRHQHQATSSGSPRCVQSRLLEVRGGYVAQLLNLGPCVDSPGCPFHSVLL
jgi:hypothetical protein